MDLNLKEMMGGFAGPWTEELHSSFLNWVEESFVRRVLAAGCAGHGDSDQATSAWGPPPRLDRFVPDTATESTRDLGRTARTRRSGTAATHSAAEDVAAKGHGARRPRRSPAAVAAGDEESDGESDVTSQHRMRKRPLRCSKETSAAHDQVGSAESEEIMSHLTKAAEAGALQAAQQENNVGE